MLETCPLNGNVCIDLPRKEVDPLVCFGVFYLDKKTFTDGYKSTYVEWLPSGKPTVCCGKSISFVGKSTIDGGKKAGKIPVEMELCWEHHGKSTQKWRVFIIFHQ